MESFSIREAADRLGVSHKVIRRLISQGTLEAYKRPGSHGAEWRVEVASLNAYQNGQSPSRHGATTRVRLPVTPPISGAPEDNIIPESWQKDKAFLQDQVRRLTDLLASALGQSPQVIKEDQPVTATDNGERAVTSALQSALQTARHEGIVAFELCSTRVIWGRPVLWRTEVATETDVESLVGAILSDAAQWIPPGEELVYIWALGGEREVLWGAACGQGWFGPEFEEALRNCRVERR